MDRLINFSKGQLMALLLILALPFSSYVSAQNTDRPLRLITAGGTVTEIVFALGAGEQVVAVDQSSQYPAQARQLPVVGYYRDLSAEGVLSFMPEKLLTITGAGRAEVLEQLRTTGVDVIQFNRPTDVEGLLELITQLGQELGRVTEAEHLIRKVNNTLPEMAKVESGKAIFLLSASDRGLISAGVETVPNLIFNYAGIRNLGSEHKGFKTISAESLAMMQPDFIVAPAHVVAGSGGKTKFCQSPNLALLNAAKTCQLLVMDSLLSLGMTPRLADAIATVKSHHQQVQEQHAL